MREYIVKRNGRGRWAVVDGDDLHADYLSEFAALQDAVDAAYAEGRRGRAATCVVSQASDFSKTVRWTYGRDPVPYEGTGLGDRRVAPPPRARAASAEVGESVPA